MGWTGGAAEAGGGGCGRGADSDSRGGSERLARAQGRESKEGCRGLPGLSVGQASADRPQEVTVKV